MDASLALQKAIRLRLVAASGVTALVPAANILDRNAHPAPMPAIILGEGTTGEDEGISRSRYQALLDLHLWAKEGGLVLAKQVAGAVRDALRDGPLSLDGFDVADLRILQTRFLRDPSGEHSHGILSLEARLVEAV